MNILVVMPKSFRFSEHAATAIDLCVHDFVAFSRYRASTTILTEAVDQPFNGFDVRFFGAINDVQTTAKRLPVAIRVARDTKADVIVVQQQYRFAATLARALPTTPVIVHHHNIPRVPRHFIDRWRFGRRVRAISCNVLVSEIAAKCLRDRWYDPGDDCLRVVHNGLDFKDWRPDANRTKTVLFVGRAHPVKGVQQAAEAARLWLAENVDWSARFILLSNPDHPQYLEEVRAALALADPARIQLQFDLPHIEVKAAFETAAIALVPSFSEPFGRTALEAHAGGAALITSGIDGLTEVSGEAAVYLRSIDAQSISAEVGKLIRNEGLRRDLADRGRKRAESQFDIRVCSSRLDDVYDAVSSAKLRGL